MNPAKKPPVITGGFPLELEDISYPCLYLPSRRQVGAGGKGGFLGRVEYIKRLPSLLSQVLDRLVVTGGAGIFS